MTAVGQLPIRGRQLAAHVDRRGQLTAVEPDVHRGDLPLRRRRFLFFVFLFFLFFFFIVSFLFSFLSFCFRFDSADFFFYNLRIELGFPFLLTLFTWFCMVLSRFT